MPETPLGTVEVQIHFLLINPRFPSGSPEDTIESAENLEWLTIIGF